MLSAPPALTQALNRDREMRRLAGEANGGIAGRPEGPGIPPAPGLRRPTPVKPTPPMGQGEVRPKYPGNRQRRYGACVQGPIGAYDLCIY
jgi:hypothetical protein